MYGKFLMEKFNQKCAAPLDFRKFLPKYSENKKWAAHNMLRPLIFGNFFRNIQKIKNGLRPSSVGCADSFPPRGSLDVRKGFPFLPIFALSKMRQGEAAKRKKQILCRKSYCPLIFGNFYRNIQKIKNGLRIICYAPHQSAAPTASPRGEALT